MTELPKVVYLDDDVENLKVTKIALRKSFQVFAFASSTEALKQIPQIKPQIILSDLKMPGMSGVDFLELSKQIYPQAIRVMITGNSDEESVISALKRAGLFDFMKKPFLRDDLLMTLNRALAQFEQEEAERKKVHKLENQDLLEHPSWLHKIDSQLREAFQKLPEYSVSERQFEEWSILIHLAMSAEKRYYHNTHHLFDIWNVTDPYVRLAILFHDVVYAQVDQHSLSGMLPKIVDILGPEFIPDHRLSVKLPLLEHLQPTDRQDTLLIYSIFGVQEGEVKTCSNGLNEFLSARVAQKTLKSVLSPWDLIQVMACIELTIPFRPKNPNGKNSPTALWERLCELNVKLNLGQSKDNCRKAAQRAVEVAHRDLWSFAAKDSGTFLNATWQLILEGNIPLQKELYTPKDYRIALTKMENFFGFLTPEIIFQRLEGSSFSQEDHEQLEQTQKNLSAGRMYMKAKIMSITVLECLDILTGGEAPIEVFRGDISSATNPNPKTLEGFLDSNLSPVPEHFSNPTVVALLEDPSDTELRYDLKNSPLALYMYRRLMPDQFEKCWETCVAFGQGQRSALDVLRTFPKNLMQAVGGAIAQVATTRSQEISEIIRGL